MCNRPGHVDVYIYSGVSVSVGAVVECGWTGSGATVLEGWRVAGDRQEVAAAGAVLCSVGRTGQGARAGFEGTGG